MSKKKKTEKVINSEPRRPIGREPFSGYGQARTVRLVVMLTPAEDAAYRGECIRENCSRQVPARSALAAKYTWISKD